MCGKRTCCKGARPSTGAGAAGSSVLPRRGALAEVAAGVKGDLLEEIFVNRQGKVFHKRGCFHISASAKTFHACKHCMPVVSVCKSKLG